MTIKQLSIFLENKTGRLAQVTKVLGDAGVNLLALSLAESSDYGILRVVVDDVAKAQQALREHQVVCAVNEVTAVEVADCPGGLAALLAVLAAAGVNVEYMYAFAGRAAGRAALVFRFDNPEKAKECLLKAGARIFRAADLA
ncbi:MAG: ACT domain-containing protein [Lentisphaeria bacterium]|jgi:hypothetical protein